jgi:DDE superfamily endonuclease
VIVFLGYTCAGHQHDYTLLKAELSPELDWFAGLSVLVDLGYLGIQTDYAAAQIQRPHKKPRKSKAQPETCLTEAQKAENKALSQVRILIEHAIGGIKRYNILVDRFRNHRENFQDDVIAICAALWNFSLTY